MSVTAPSFAVDLPRTAAQRQLAAAFAAAGLENAPLDARLLLCAALGIDHAGLLRDPDLPLGRAAVQLAGLAARRLAGEPVSRLRGCREFYGETFTITPGVLDPRADTETLVEAVLDALAERKHAVLRLLDLGTGSGAILAALLRHLPRAFGVGVDVSAAACAVARGNLITLGLDDRAAVVQGRWTAALSGRFDVIVSNPPYVASGEIATLAREVRDHDPRLALDGGADGLAAYRALIPAAGVCLAGDGVLGLEIGYGQCDPVVALLRASGFASVEVRADLGGHPRAVVAQIGSLSARGFHALSYPR